MTMPDSPDLCKRAQNIANARDTGLGTLHPNCSVKNLTDDILEALHATRREAILECAKVAESNKPALRTRSQARIRGHEAAALSIATALRSKLNHDKG